MRDRKTGEEIRPFGYYLDANGVPIRSTLPRLPEDWKPPTIMCPACQDKGHTMDIPERWVDLTPEAHEAFKTSLCEYCRGVDYRQ